MKKFALAVALSFIVSASSFASEKIYIGGTLGFSSNSSSYSGGGSASNSYLTLAPQIGYIIDDSLDVGVDIQLYTGDTTGHGFIPYVRYNLVQSGDFTVFAKGSFGYKSEKANVSGAKALTSVIFSAAPVIQYNLVDSWFLFVSADVLTLSFGSQDNSSRTIFGLNSGNTLGNVGITYYFN
ncbi:MAG: hypothetical protein FWF00_02740 [Endomicrobia bacterium]|nr:hypothetical protein [Endomicrobiia bacterium]MCL2506570.1 hypothetical protein [Endomicrobiia bacterium]MCL2506593.1 hypothetical protein [Endomicrobiia bacterium]